MSRLQLPFAVLGALVVVTADSPRIRMAAADVVPTLGSAANAATSRTPSRAPATEFLKGNTHVHSRYSGDASTSLDEIARWYGDHGYDFVVVTDHNRVTVPTEEREVLMIPGVELTRNPGRCEPAPPEQDGRCRLHANGLFVDPDEQLDWERAHSRARIDIYRGQIDALQGLGALVQLNHPTWHHGVDGALLAELAEQGVTFVEIANAAFSGWNEGIDDYPSTEDIWDEALTAGATVWAIASDDAHHFDPDRADGDHSYYPPGGGFVMVRAEPTVASIRAAMARGDFYSSTGVLLDRVDVTGDRVRIQVSVDSPGEHTITWIGDGGAVLREDRGRAASFAFEDLPGDATYLRAVVSDGDGASAWVQPVRLD